MSEQVLHSEVTVRPLDISTWESVLHIQLEEDQKEFLPDALYSIAQSRFEQITPCGIWYQGRVVGMIMYGNFSSACWITRVMVDREFQNRGIGKAAVSIVLKQLRSNPQCREVRTSFSRRNAAAEVLFTGLGFSRISDADFGEEVVMRWR